MYTSKFEWIMNSFLKHFQQYMAITKFTLISIIFFFIVSKVRRIKGILKILFCLNLNIFQTKFHSSKGYANVSDHNGYVACTRLI